MSDHNHDSRPEGSSTFLIGAIVGAAVIYLFTTKSGQKIKKELIRDVLGALEGIGDNLEEKEKEVEKELEEKKEDVQEKIEDVKEEVKEKMEEKKEQIQENLAKTQESVQKQAQEIKQDVQQAAAEVPTQVAEIQKKGRHFFFRKRHRGES